MCRPRKQRTYKYHADVHPLQGASPCGSPQAVMIHNLLLGCRNLRSSLEEAHLSVTPGKDAQRTQPGDSREQRKSASKRLTSISDAYIRTTSIRSLEEAHSAVTPGKDAKRTQPGARKKQRSSASKRLTSRMRKIITIYGLYKSFIISISVLMTRLSSLVRSLEYPMMRGSFEYCDIHYSCR